MAAENWKLFNNVKEYIGDGTIDLDSDVFHMILVGSGYTEDLTDDTYADVSANELAEANGYETGGKVITATWTQPTAGTAMFDCDDQQWTASGGAITARRAIIVHNAAGSGDPQSTDKLVATCLLDATPADVSASDGGTFTVAINANGIFRISGGTAGS